MLAASLVELRHESERRAARRHRHGGGSIDQSINIMGTARDNKQAADRHRLLLHERARKTAAQGLGLG